MGARASTEISSMLAPLASTPCNCALAASIRVHVACAEAFAIFTAAPEVVWKSSIRAPCRSADPVAVSGAGAPVQVTANRSEEHTSELQSLRHLVCRLLLEKKKKKQQ